MSSTRLQTQQAQGQQQQQQQQQQLREPFLLKATNVSNPSIVHNKASQQSIAASEDYYSLSGSNSSTYSGDSVAHDHPAHSQHTITRFQTPPSRYRTPLQSAVHLPQHAEEHAPVDESAADEQQQFRKTPMRGQGKRRLSVDERQAAAAAAATTAAAATSGPSKPSAVRRKPVPSTVMEAQRESATSGEISPVHARSSVARDIDREASPPTPGMDDTPYIHFALDQLTRDEEVRGSRQYAIQRDSYGNYPTLTPLQQHQQQHHPISPQRPAAVQTSKSFSPQRRSAAYQQLPQEEQIERDQPEVNQQAGAIVPPPRNPSRQSQQIQPLDISNQRSQRQGPSLYEAVLTSPRHPLKAMPGTLRPVRLGLFLLTVFAYLVCLLIAAIWSRVNGGLTSYGSFGDAKYFVFRYLPILLGMLLLIWLVQVEIALYRIAPFIAMANDHPATRLAGVKLPLQPKGFVLPYFGHWRAKQAAVGLFLFVAWLQLFTIPLLASSFNVYNTDSQWSWLAVQGAIWTVIVLYILLLLATIVLFVWLRKVRSTGVKWDPRTLADLVVLLERSNALDESSVGGDIPRLGLWRTQDRHEDIFHGYAVAEKEGRQYAVGQDGRIHEKLPHSPMTPMGEKAGHENRYSDPHSDVEAQIDPVQRSRSKDAILPRAGTGSTYHSAHQHQSHHAEHDDLVGLHGNILPWFLRPSLAMLWPIIAIVLLLAFLIVSFLPTTNILNGFLPSVSSIVDKLGFSSGNFLFAFLPATLALLCWLFWLDVEFATRRLQPFAALAETSEVDHHDNEKHAAGSPTQLAGASADHTLLTSYPATPLPLVPLTALAHGHFRLAYLASVTLISLALPVLAGGVFWSQFSVPQQRVRVYVQPAGYYALCVFLVIFALSWLAIYPSASLRHSGDIVGRMESFEDVKRLFARSRLVDEVAFRAPSSRIDLVTRLMVGPLGGARAGVGAAPAAATQSKVSLKDSLRGFGRARMAVPQQDLEASTLR